jgi:hypothetical protein
MIEVFYCKSTESPLTEHKLSPSPSISISPEIYYANDSIIGYTYNITLTGYANALRKELDLNSVNFGTDKTIDHMGDIRYVFNTNGGNLYVKQGGQDILIAKGATIKNIDFSTSDNRWINYSQYSIQIEFNEIDFIGCSDNTTITCNSTIFHTPNQINNDSVNDNLIDMKKYKIKTFTDKWSFTIDDQIYQSYNNYYNNIFKVTYTISATGKNYYQNDNLAPAWQQAKSFVQDRLYKQINGLITGILKIKANNHDGCLADLSPSQLYSIDTTTPRESGLISHQGAPHCSTLRDNIGCDIKYDIYNESINCDTSESDGTFNLTYSATLKRNNPALSPLENAATHTFTKSLSVSDDVTVAIQGNIQGLVRGGFLYYNNDFKLPNTGSFISTIDSTETKFSNALAYYKAQIGHESDLLDGFKNDINLSKSELMMKNPDSELPKPTSFNVDYSYANGTIGYNANYDRSFNTSRDRGYSNISIVRNDPTEIIQEFVIPGRAAGPIIQKLNMKTPRTISVSIEGASAENRRCIDLSQFNVCEDSLPKFQIKKFDQLIVNNNSNWIKTKEDYDSNPIDGSYSISLEYTCRG